MNKATLLKLKITNFKKIESADVDFQGRSFLLIGKNQVGKTSFIQALKILFNIDQMPPDPVTHGKDHGEMSTIFEKNGVKYKVVYEFTNEKATFKFTTEDGLPVRKPKTVLDTLVGSYVDIFDIIKQQKYAEGRRENEKMFLKLANLDADKVYKFDAEIKTAENNRLEVGREVTRLKGVVDSSDVNINIGPVIDLDPIYASHMDMIASESKRESEAFAQKEEVLKELLDINDVIETLNELRDKARLYEEMDQRRKEYNANIEANEKRILALQVEISALQESNVKLLRQAHENTYDVDKRNEVRLMGQATRAQFDSIEDHNKKIAIRAEEVFHASIDEIKRHNETVQAAVAERLQDAIDKANTHNENVRKGAEIAEIKQALETNEIAYEDLTRDIVRIRDARRSYIMSGAFPIDGMEYTDEGIKYNGMMLDEGVMSTSDIIELGIKLSNSYNPDGLNFMPIPNASLFDNDHLVRVQEFLHKNGLIGAFEMVDRVKDGLTIEFIK